MFTEENKQNYRSKIKINAKHIKFIELSVLIWIYFVFSEPNMNKNTHW